METLINFSGAGFEVGQSKKGLYHSPENARKYFYYLEDLGIKFVDQGDVAPPNTDERVTVFSRNDLKNIEWLKYYFLYLKTKELLKKSLPLLSWGGDHSVALSTVGAFASENPEGFVVWIDAHADLNLPEHSLTGNFHGMPLSILLNLDGVLDRNFPWITRALDTKKLIYLGLRDIDPFELETIRSEGIKVFTYDDIQRVGISSVAREILNLTKGYPLHVSFDIDSVDPKFAPSTGVPVKGGLTPNDLDILGEELFKESMVRSVDIVEINPHLGTPLQVDRTYLIAFNFLRTLFNNHPGENYDGINERAQREDFTGTT